MPLCVAKAAFKIKTATAAPLPSPSLNFKSKIGSFPSLFRILEWPGSEDKCEIRQWSNINLWNNIKVDAAAVHIKPSKRTGIDLSLAEIIDPTIAESSLPP